MHTSFSMHSILADGRSSTCMSDIHENKTRYNTVFNGYNLNKEKNLQGCRDSVRPDSTPGPKRPMATSFLNEVCTHHHI